MSTYSAWGFQDSDDPARLRSQLESMRRDVEMMQRQPGVPATYVRRDGTSAMFISMGRVFVVDVPERMHAKLVAGCGAKLTNDGKLMSVDGPSLPGPVHKVVARIDADQIEIAFQMETRAVFCAFAVEPGDRVMLDNTAIVATRNLGKPSDGFAVAQEEPFSWDQIGGLADAKRKMREAIEGAHTHAALHKRFAKRATKGVLLWGPPGTGKTLLAKAAASALRTIHDGAGGSGFVYVKGPELLNRFVGASEDNVRSLFVRAREHKRKHGWPAVIFVDEADAVLSKRGSNRTSDMERTIVPQFLAEMDGIDDSGALVILATNRPDTLDPAVVRVGRIDVKIHVTRPTQADATEIARGALAGKPLAKGVKLANAAECVSAEAFDESHIVQTATLTESGRSIPIPLHAVINGAIVVGIVEGATSLAMARDADGISLADIRGAVAEITREHSAIDLGDEVREFIAERAARPEARRVTV